MSEPNADLGMRLYGMMQFLLTEFATQEETQAAAPRNVVAKEDALDAVALLAAAIDEPAQKGVIPREHAKHMASLLMVIRDYIQPLPPGLAEDGTDLTTADLAEMVDAIHTAKHDLL
ncbi:hypothetical protein ACIRJS_44995 [Streptomyces sp. NPDC102340]|uniref:hypothetical protein n=1 Tax=unclassified Streptomyces TaxID=2593676 RepID=UPI003804ECF3